MDLDRGGGELLRREVGRDEETRVVVFIKQLDVVDRPSAVLAVLGEVELHLVGSVCAGAANAVTPSEFTVEKFLAAWAAERERT